MELTVLLSLALAIILMVISVLFIQKVSVETRETVTKGLLSALTLQTEKIQSFILQRGEAVEAMLKSPFVMSWFENYREREKDLSNDADFSKLIKYFKVLSERDEKAKSYFFASAITGEYFDSTQGRTSELDGVAYDARKRTWWPGVMEQNKLFIAQPEIDYLDGTMLSVMQRPVYSDKGELLGIGGADVLLSTMRDEVASQLKYQGQGEPFIINRDGRVIVFPADSKVIEANIDIAEVDNKMNDVSGFSYLKQQMQANENGIIEITWKGKPHMVAFNHISLEQPYVDWMVGLIIPTNIIEKPILDSVKSAIYSILIILISIAAAVWLVASRITRPFKEVVNAMGEVAHGEGDLTARLKVESSNEVGLFAQQFNLFIAHIQKIMQENKKVIEELYESAEKVTVITNLSAQKAVQQRDATDMVATAAEELSYSVTGVSANSSSARHSTEEADAQVKKGVDVVEAASNSINTLAQTVQEASQVIDNLNTDSSKIGEVLEVIRSIAEQTNLLALNAAIEAARAGEQGRGFAVVADEVRSLASRTQESTESIRQIIDGLQANANNAVAAMEVGKEHAQAGVDKSMLVQDVLQSIAIAISEIQTQSIEIANSTKEQAKASGEITQQAAEIRKLSEETASQIAEVQAGTKAQREDIHKLSELISVFKI